MSRSTFDPRRSGALVRSAVGARMPAMLGVLLPIAVLECPKRTGRLAASLESQVDEAGPDRVVGRLGTNLDYGPHVCLGVPRQAANDFLARATVAGMPEVLRIARDG